MRFNARHASFDCAPKNGIELFSLSLAENLNQFGFIFFIWRTSSESSAFPSFMQAPPSLWHANEMTEL